MMMTWQDGALVAAGVIGAATAVVHGVLTQRFMVAPLEALMASERRTGAQIRRLVPALLQFSTFAWLGGGLALAAAPWLGQEARLAVSMGVGALYLYGAVGNAWATRGRHPGWMLLAASVVLIGLSALPMSG